MKGTEGQHLEQARENLNIAQHLDSSTWIGRQWACTMYFYSAVHCVQATVSARRGIEPAGNYPPHDFREAWMDLNASSLAAGYKKLRRASQRARYDLVRITESELQAYAAAARTILTSAEAGQLGT